MVSSNVITIYITRFPNLGILHVTRKKVVDVLVERFTQQLLLQEKRSESAVTGEQPQLSDGVCIINLLLVRYLLLPRRPGDDT